MIKKFTSLLTFVFSLSFTVSAGAPSGYYNNAENKSGASLLKALESCISRHTELGYGTLFSYYPQTDRYPDVEAIWDIYSTKQWPFNEKCGNYSVIGDCYNKEHSVPKSWFNSASPMYSDIMHIFPTDGRVNQQRSNFPYGECSRGTYVASSGGVKPLGRLGSSSTPGYNGTVFEPDDQYKGDIARTYFYMAACYNSRISSWSSDNFSGNSYPAFSQWTLDMLLRWHRADPVSQKELDRNEAVYKVQGNRNPFIDHPELAEYIWGDHKSESWNSTLNNPAAINSPADGSSFYVGLTTRYVSRSAEMAVKGTNIDKNIKVSVDGDAFSCNVKEIAAADANAGTNIVITFTPTANKTYTGTLTLATGNVSSTVTLTGEALDGLPVAPASRVTSNSFTANWSYVGDDIDGKYILEVSDREGTLNGYPAFVDAKAESYTVRDLQPSTEYIYTVYTTTLNGNRVNVTTAPAMPYIEFLFDGDLYLQGQTGVPTAPAEILLATENIESEITITVGEPFELSFDKAQWGATLRLSPDENRFYLRMNASAAGEFESQLQAETDGYRNDAATIRGKATRVGSFLEDFEGGAEINGYCDLFDGSAARWTIKNGGFWEGDPAISGKASLRFVKSGERFIAMTENRENGIGTVSFLAKKWDNSKDEKAVVDIESSIDGGTTWFKHGTVEVSATTEKTFTVSCNAAGKARLRLNQVSGGRWLLDDIAITDVTTGLADPAAERHQWDAFSRDGKIAVEVHGGNCPEIAIYSLDGHTVFSGKLEAGIHTFDATRGQYYIVAGGDFGRTILVR